MPANHLFRRAMDAIPSVYQGDGEKIEIPPMAALIFFLTCLAFFVLLFTISYTYGHLIPTLCMIESPETSAYVPVSTIASEDEPPAYTEGEVPATTDDEPNLVRNKPFTTSMRATINHLKARAGYWSRFRGLGLFFVLGIMRNILVGLISIGSSKPLVMGIAAVIAETALANVHMTWIHIVISEPNPKRWWRRLPSPALQSWKRIAPAVAVWSLTTQFVFLLPMTVIGAGGAKYTDPAFEPSRRDMYLAMMQMFGAVLLMIALFGLLEIPAMVMMTRVAASMLPEEDETIVPFDRTFGGKVTPAIIGGDGKIGMLEAWKSFPWSSRKRLIVLCVKVAAIVMAVWFLFTLVVTLEAHLLFGEEAFGKLMKALRGGATAP